MEEDTLWLRSPPAGQQYSPGCKLHLLISLVFGNFCHHNRFSKLAHNRMDDLLFVIITGATYDVIWRDNFPLTPARYLTFVNLFTPVHRDVGSLICTCAVIILRKPSDTSIFSVGNFCSGYIRPLVNNSGSPAQLVNKIWGLFRGSGLVRWAVSLLQFTPPKIPPTCHSSCVDAWSCAKIT